MASTNTALVAPSAEEVSSMSDAAVARAFAMNFPTITLTWFRAFRKGHLYVISHNDVSITGAATEMLRRGFLQEHMIPPGRKRHLYGQFWPEGHGSSWTVRRLNAGRLEAHFHIMGGDDDGSCPERNYRDDLPADHPLQMCHPRLWPFGDARELRCYFERTRADARSCIENQMSTLDRNLAHMSQHGYSVHADARAHMRQMVHLFEKQLLTAFDSARVVSEQAPQLSLVVGVEVDHA
jgi:hypothetical protein